MKLFIVPGFPDLIKDERYQRLQALLKQTKFTPILVPVDWHYKVMTDYVNQVSTFIYKNTINNDKFYLLGFSLGAYASFVTANKLKPKHVFLCSLSPYFAEDLPATPVSWKQFLGKNRTKDFLQYYFNTIVKEYRIPTTLFVGGKELGKFPTLRRRIDEAHKQMLNAKLIVIDKVDHEIGHPKYQEAIVKELQSFE